jgi:hypothetical protein
VEPGLSGHFLKSPLPYMATASLSCVTRSPNEEIGKVSCVKGSPSFREPMFSPPSPQPIPASGASLAGAVTFKFCCRGSCSGGLCPLLLTFTLELGPEWGCRHYSRLLSTEGLQNSWVSPPECHGWPCREGCVAVLKERSHSPNPHALCPRLQTSFSSATAWASFLSGQFPGVQARLLTSLTLASAVCSWSFSFPDRWVAAQAFLDN